MCYVNYINSVEDSLFWNYVNSQRKSCGFTQTMYGNDERVDMQLATFITQLMF